MEIRIREIHDAQQLKIINTLAWKIFPQTYRELLSVEQIPYMMHMMYDEAVLRQEFAGEMHFALILDGETPVGYLSWHPLECEGAPAIKLEKLYLDFAYHGKSIGNAGLKFILETAKKSERYIVLLNVNKENLRAQKAYERAGFRRWKSERNPIGNGFYMDDYVMRCDILQE